MNMMQQSCFTNSYESEKDDIALLLDSVPEIESLFSVGKRIGHGTFSSVYLGQAKTAKHGRRNLYAIKHIIPTSHPSRIYMELKCLTVVGGKDNVMAATHCFRNMNHIVFIMPYIPHDSFTDYVGVLTARELALYFHNLFLALRRVHSYGIIHRDVKPANFLYSRKLQRYALVDFGLAQEIGPLPESSISSSTLKRSRKQTSSVSQDTLHIDSSRGVKRKLSVDSPSKHTRLAEAARPSNSDDGSGDNFEGFDSVKVNLRRGMSDSQPNVKTHKGSHRSCVPSKSVSVLQEVRTKSGQSVLRPSSCSCYGSAQVCSVCLGRRNERASRAGTPGFRAPEVLLRHPHQTAAVDMWSAGIIMLCLLSGRYPFFRAVDDNASLAEITTITGTKMMKKTAAKLGKLFTCSEDKPPLDLKKVCETLCSGLRNKFLTNKSFTATTKLVVGDECGGCRQRSRCVCFKLSIIPKLPDASTVSATETNLENADKCFSKLTHTPVTEDGKTEIEIYPSAAYHLLSCLLDPNPATRITADEALRHPFLQSQ